MNVTIIFHSSNHNPNRENLSDDKRTELQHRLILINNQFT
jgi:hypothetical protein